MTSKTTSGTTTTDLPTRPETALQAPQPALPAAQHLDLLAALPEEELWLAGQKSPGGHPTSLTHGHLKIPHLGLID